jgi:hypothetical protein
MPGWLIVICGVCLVIPLARLGSVAVHRWAVPGSARESPRRQPRELVPATIEAPRGLLVACLRAAGRPVYPVNPMAVAPPLPWSAVLPGEGSNSTLASGQSRPIMRRRHGGGSCRMSRG